MALFEVSELHGKPGGRLEAGTALEEAIRHALALLSEEDRSVIVEAARPDAEEAEARVDGYVWGDVPKITLPEDAKEGPPADGGTGGAPPWVTPLALCVALGAALVVPGPEIAAVLAAVFFLAALALPRAVAGRSWRGPLRRLRGGVLGPAFGAGKVEAWVDAQDCPVVRETGHNAIMVDLRPFLAGWKPLRRNEAARRLGSQGDWFIEFAGLDPARRHDRRVVGVRADHPIKAYGEALRALAAEGAFPEGAGSMAVDAMVRDVDGDRAADLTTRFVRGRAARTEINALATLEGPGSLSWYRWRFAWEEAKGALFWAGFAFLAVNGVVSFVFGSESLTAQLLVAAWVGGRLAPTPGRTFELLWEGGSRKARRGRRLPALHAGRAHFRILDGSRMAGDFGADADKSRLGVRETARADILSPGHSVVLLMEPWATDLAIEDKELR